MSTPDSLSVRPDPRFFSTQPPLTVVDAISMVGATATHSGGAQREVSHAAPLTAAGEGSVVFASGPGALAGEANGGGAPCLVLVPSDAAAAAAARFPEATIAAHDAPKAGFARLAAALHDSLLDAGLTNGLPAPKIDPAAQVSPTAVVMPGAEIGADAVIGPLAMIGVGVVIGRGTRIGPNSSISHAVIGAECRIAAGVRIGEAGFGYVPDGGMPRAVPQLGRVQIADHVELGANTTVDRGALTDTVIGEGTKIDNLVQVAHNCRIGKAVLIAALTGISGSCVIGDGVMIGGQVGMADHLTIGDGAMIVARAGLMKNVPAGERWGGVPAKPAREWMKDVAAISRLTNKDDK